MAKIKIYSPPIITAKGKIKLGHGANLVWCDILAKVFSEKGLPVEYSFPSWNHQGKMFDHFSDMEDSYEALNKIEYSLEQKLSFFGLERHNTYRDIDEESRRNSQEMFRELLRKGFIEPNTEGAYFLKINEIEKRTDLVSHIVGTNFYPKGGKGRMLDLIKTLNGSYPITKPRKFATPIPGDENSTHKINPIFDLAVSPLLFSQTPNDYSIDGLKTMLHGTFIPFVIYSGLFNIPFSKNVSFHGFALPDSQSLGNDLENFYQKNNSDILRGSSLLCTSSMEDTILNNIRLKKITKGTSKLVKLAWFFKNFKVPTDLHMAPSPQIKEEVLKMHHASAMNHTLEKVFSLSGQLGGNLLTEKDYMRYISVLNDSKIFFPSTFNKATNILMTANSTN